MTLPFPRTDFLPPSSPTVRPATRFWMLQLVVWPAYAAALMLPWLGTYTVASMVPNKLMVAASGLVLSSGLRALYREVMRRHLAAGVMLVVVLLASLMAGFAWGAMLSAVLGGSAALDLRHLGALGAGAPQFSGGFYHALILLAWSLAYLLLRTNRSVPSVDTGSEMPVQGSAMPAAVHEDPSPTASRIVLRDGRRTMVLEADEIDWIEADGDYVRVHAGARRLLIRATMAAIQSTLPHRDYARIHRSSIVRISQVRELLPKPNNEFEVVLRDGTKLRASRTYADRLRDALGIPRAQRVF